MNKKGMTLLMLVIYIAVLFILFGMTITTVISNNKVNEVGEEAYKAIIKEYINEFNTTKNYYTVKNNDFPSGIIEGSELINYIPSISLEHTAYILIEDGEIKYNKTNVSSSKEQEYLEKLFNEGIIEEYTP